MCAHHQPRQRQHHDTRNDRLQNTDDDLFDSDTGDADGREQPVFDLFAPAKVDH